LKCGPWRASLGDGQRSLVTPGRVLIKYKKNLIFFVDKYTAGIVTLSLFKSEIRMNL